jgi:putative phosphoesterase
VKTRVGVISDTHCPEFMERLPAALAEALQGVDLILHAGDVDGASTLADLARMAPVEAVRGDHDAALVELPNHRNLVVGGQRIVVVHGNRSRWIEEPQTLLWTLSLGYFRPHRGLPRALRKRFPEADVIVFGHTHRPHVERLGGALLFNPGGVHQWNRRTTTARLHRSPGWFEWCWLQVARHLRVTQEPTVGMLEIDDAGAVASVLSLESG